MAEAYGPMCCTLGLALESILSRSPKAQYSFVPKLSHHGGKNKKNLSYGYAVSSYSMRSLFFSVAKRNGVFSSDVVFCCAATSDDGGAGVKAGFQTQSHDISTKARRAKDNSRGVLKTRLIEEARMSGRAERCMFLFTSERFF